MPIQVAAGVEVTAGDGTVRVSGPKGESSMRIPPGVSVERDGHRVLVRRSDDTRENKSRQGLCRSLIANMVEGVTKGFVRELEIQGVGFKASVQGSKVTMALGFSKPVEFQVPEGVRVAEQGGTVLTVSGVDKQKVGETAARLRAFFPAEPYKGKGVRYRGEYVRRKVGKTVA
jgi:large subunit ribosomal protein L6